MDGAIDKEILGSNLFPNTFLHPTNPYLDRVRAHAKSFDRILRQQFQDNGMNVRIFRSLYQLDDGTVIAASIFQQRTGQVSAEATWPAHTAFNGGTNAISGASLTYIEIAVFLGLAQVEPERVTWVEQPFDTKSRGV